MREKLKKEKAALDAEDKIRTTKDGRSRKATYYDHIHSLFSLYSLSDEQQEILRSLTLIPAGGIISRVFAGWMEQRNMNTINDLLDMGFIHPKNDWEVFMHPMIREVAIEELKPSVISCSVLLNSLQEISLRHGQEFMENRRVFHTVECIMETIKKDNQEKYLLFLKNMFQYMDKYRYVSGMRAVLDEMTVILSDKTMGTSADRAFILDCEVALEKNPLKAMQKMPSHSCIRLRKRPISVKAGISGFSPTIPGKCSDPRPWTSQRKGSLFWRKLPGRKMWF